MSTKMFALGLASCTAIACSLTVLGMGRVEAQTTPGATTLSDQTLKDGQQLGGSAYTITGSNLNLMQLIHNAQLNGGRSSDQFREEQNDSLNSAVEGFKAQRNQELKLTPATFSSGNTK
ncbi:hypothetical protein V2H45_07160 [Tumidithrix elongata RA019]|uniref:Uncharacterized protein n=1 Tax=Tumidithrix elongata BACA0141 TaxID=2716417 RepID=A0AAW9PY30_9CYAN|nr:hypothetical protein [Tumidithrix elongata RA019]